eukprot:4788775-Pyramimonas_sp.AAC.1
MALIRLSLAPAASNRLVVFHWRRRHSRLAPRLRRAVRLRQLDHEGRQQNEPPLSTNTRRPPGGETFTYSPVARRELHC